MTAPDPGYLPRLRRASDRLARIAKAVPAAERVAGGLTHGAMSAVAAVLAWLPTQALGLPEGFWAAITAIAVVQTEFGATRTTARDQFAGASIGGAVAVAMVSTMGQHVWSFALAVIVACCWLLNVASAAQLAGITATIILLVPHRGSVERMMLSRLAEVGWGVSVAIVVVWGLALVGRWWSTTARNAVIPTEAGIPLPCPVARRSGSSLSKTTGVGVPTSRSTKGRRGS